MGILNSLAQANQGVTALATARTARAVEQMAAQPIGEAAAYLHSQEMLRLDTLIQQNNRIIELLVENLGYLARQKSYEVEQAQQQAPAADE